MKAVALLTNGPHDVVLSEVESAGFQEKIYDPGLLLCPAILLLPQLSVVLSICSFGFVSTDNYCQYACLQTHQLWLHRGGGGVLARGY